VTGWDERRSSPHIVYNKMIDYYEYVSQNSETTS